MSIDSYIVLEDLSFQGVYNTLGYNPAVYNPAISVSATQLPNFYKSFPSAWNTFSNAPNIEGDNIKALMTLEIIIIIFGKKF